MPELLDEAFGRRRREARRPARPRRARPRLPRAVRRRLDDRRAHRRRRDGGRRSGGSAGRTPPRATGGCATWLTELYRAEIDRFIGANFDSPLGLLGPDLARLAALGGFGRLGPRVARFLPDERLQRIFSFQALYAGVPPAPGARRLRRDRLHGHDRRGVLPARRDAGGRPGAGRRRRRRRAPRSATGATVTGLERSGGRVTAVRHRRRRRAGRRERLAVRRRRAHPGPAGGPPAARPAPRGARCRCAGRPAPSCCTPGSPAPAPTLAHHTISFGAAWESTFRRDHRPRAG